MFKEVIFFACLLGVAFATQQKYVAGESTSMVVKELASKFDSMDTRQKIESLNDIADVLLTEIRYLMEDLGLDPLSLPDVHEGFEFKPIIIKYHGEIDMTRGWAQDVSEIYRNGDVKMNYVNRVVTIEVPIQFTKILFNYDYSAKLMNLGPEGGIEGSAANIKIFFSLSIDFDNLQVILNKFEISKIGTIKVKFTGNGLIDWFVNLLIPIVTTIFKGLISFIAELIVRNTLVSIIDALNNALQNFQPPPLTPDTLLGNMINY